jgi:hypothetical protein
VRESLCPVSLTEMFSAWDRRERPPEEGAAAGLQGFGVDKTFLSSLKGILLETELVTAAFPNLVPPPLPSQPPGMTLGWPPVLTIFHPPSQVFCRSTHRLYLLQLPAFRPLLYLEAVLACIIHRKTEVRWKDSFRGY